MGRFATPDIVHVWTSNKNRALILEILCIIIQVVPTGTVLQKQVMQPLVQGVRFAGPERAQFTIGIEGCGQRTTMVVVCSDDNNGCFAGVGR